MLTPITEFLLIINIGALLLAALYHTILYLHRKDRILRYYCLYLWVSFMYLAFRYLYKNFVNGATIAGINISPDDTLQMLTFLVYIKFIAHALQINKSDKPFIKGFTKSAPWVILVYILWTNIHANLDETVFYIYAYLGIRVFLLIFGFLALIFSLKQRPSPYYHYLAAGASLIIFFGLVSTLVRIIYPYEFLGLTPFAWIQFGYFFDVVLFSAAIGYRFKMESIEREKALQTVMLQQQTLQKIEMEKLQADYMVREEERLRISKDLHDDLGSSLSSIQLFVEVIEKVFDNNPKKAKELLADVKLNSQNASENMGDLVWALNSGKAFNSTFEERLKNYCYQLLSPKDISCMVDIPEWFGTKITNINVLRNLMMVTKECLNNIAKYSEATHCEVAAVLTDMQLVIRISDDGIGFDTTKMVHGNGMRNMRQRIESLNGQLIVQTKKGEGCNIGILLPVNSL